MCDQTSLSSLTSQKNLKALKPIAFSHNTNKQFTEIYINYYYSFVVKAALKKATTAIKFNSHRL